MASTMTPIAGSDEEIVFDAFRQGVSVLTMEQQFAGLLPRISAGSRPKRLSGTTPITSHEIDLNRTFKDLSENRYAANDTLIMWARMGIGSGTHAVPSPADLGPNDITIEYEGAFPGFTGAFIGDKKYPSVQLEDTPDDINISAISPDNGLLSFSIAPDTGPSTTMTDTPFSISFWVNFDTLALDQFTNPTGQLLFSKEGIGPAEYTVQTLPSGTDTLLFFALNSPTGQANATTVFPFTGPAIEENEWYHLVFTYTGVGGPAAHDEMECYINGVLQTGLLRTGNLYTGMVPDWASPLHIGADNVGDNELDGKLAEFAVWDSALSVSEVQAIYNATQFGTKEYYIRRGGFRDYTAGTHFNDSMVTPVASLLDPVSTGAGTTNEKTGKWEGGMATVPLTDGGESIITVPNYEVEQLNFGQPKVFKDDEPYEDFQKFHPVLYLTDDNSTLMYPLVLANASMKDPDQYDGVIEPFMIKSRASRLSPEAPFFAHDIRASLQSDASECSRLKAVPILQFVDIEQSAFDYYEDGIENFGAKLMIMDKNEKLTERIGPVYPGYLTQAESVINPFIESSDPEEFHTRLHISMPPPPGSTASIDPGNMLGALQMMAEHVFERNDGTVGYMSSHSNNDLLPHHHKSSGAGFTYENNGLGTDSIAFGGLLK